MSLNCTSEMSAMTMASRIACAQAILLAIVIALISLVQFKLMGTDVEY